MEGKNTRTQEGNPVASGSGSGRRSRVSFKIVIKRVERPYSDALDEEFNWLCQTLGFFEPIDKDKTASNVFREIVKDTEKGRAVSSSELSGRLEMSRGSIINHLNNLLRSGLIVREGRLYRARGRSVFRTVEEIEEDILRVFERMKKISREIDEGLSLNE